MSKGNVDKFLELMQTDEGLARKMAACLYMLENGGGESEGSGDFISREIVPLAKEYGLEFTAKDFLDYTEDAKAKVGLTAEDLAEVSGGKGGVRAALMGTLALLGVAAAPAAMEMVSGGEVAPFSMVASAADNASQEQLDDLKMGIAALKSLKGTIQSSKLTQDEKDALKKSRDNILKAAEAALQSKDKAAVEKEEKEIKDYLKEIKTNGLTNNWFMARNKFLGLSARLKKLEGKTFLNQQEIANLRNIANTLKKNLIEHTKKHGKETKATGTNENNFEAKIKSFEDILARAEKLNKNKEQLVQNLQKVQSLVNYNEGKKINEQIAALNDEIKDFSPENIEKKEADFNAINAFTNAIIEVNNLQKEVETLLTNKHANEESLNDIKGALDIAARDLTKENAADISKVLTEIKKKLNAEKENIKKIKSESKEKKQKEQEEKDKNAAEDHEVAETVNFFKTTKGNAESTFPMLKNRLDGLENFVVNVQKRTDAASVQESINSLRARIDSFGDVTYENANEKATELENIKKEIESLMDVVYDFEENLSTHVTKPKKNIGEMLTLLKTAAIQAKNQAAVAEIKKLEQELATVPEERPRSQKDLDERATKLNSIRESIPQINKATTLKKIAEKVDDEFVKVFDDIIKDIEAADSVENVKKAEIDIDNAEKTLRGSMRTEIIEANKMAHILHEIAKIFGLNQLKGNFVDLIDTFERFNYGGASIDELYKVYQDVETVNIAENELKNYLGERIDKLIEDANKLKVQANGVDDDLKKSFEETANSLKNEKENLLKDLFYATKTITSARKSLAERQGDLMPKLALKKQIDDLKEQATKLAELLKGKGIINHVSEASFSTIKQALERINLSDKLNNITKKLAEKKYYMNDLCKRVYQQLVAELELDALLEQEVMGTEIQDELKAIKAGLPKADEANADTVVKAFDDVKAVKTKMANKLLEWHKILSTHKKTDLLSLKAADYDLGVEKIYSTATKKEIGKITSKVLNDAIKTAVKLTKECDVNGVIKDIRAEIDELLQNEIIDELLQNEIIDNDAKEKLNNIKNTLNGKVDATNLLLAIANIHDIKIDKANKLLEGHKILSDYHNKGYHKEGVDPTTIEGKLDYLKGNAQKMVADNGSGDKLYTGGLNELANVATEIAKNLHTDIAEVIDTVKSYKGFRTTGFRLLGGIRIGDYTAAWQANTLVTFLRDSVVDVSDLKFVDKETRAKLAKDIKHIFDQIKIDRETGKYYLPRFYNQLGAVNHDDLKLICEAYDVVADDFGKRVSYTPFVEGTTETTNRLSLSSMFSSFTGAKEPSQLINKTTHLINELKKVSRLDLLDVSPESREALKKDIIEISTQMKSRARSWRFHKLYYSFSGIDDSQTKNMQDGLTRILEFYNYINGQK